MNRSQNCLRVPQNVQVGQIEIDDMRYDILPVETTHFEDWLRLRKCVYNGVDDEFHQQEMALILDDAEKECLLAVLDGGAVFGMVEVSLRNVVDGCLTSPVGYIEGIFVDPAHRGLGVARVLLQRAEHWCRSHGCQEIATDAELDNKEAQRFHQNMGFVETYRIIEFRKSL